MNIDLILEPEKTLKFGEVEILIKGPSPILAQKIEQIKYRPYSSQEEIFEAGLTYVKKVICCSVKDVKNLSVNNKPFKLAFKNQDEIDDYSYNVLMQLFDVYLKTDVQSKIIEFYNKAINNELIEIEESDKKKD